MKSVVIIGAGIAGMEAASFLGSMGYKVLLLEKENNPGGHLRNWEKLFPTMRKGSEVLDFLNNGIVMSGVKLECNVELSYIRRNNGGFDVAFIQNNSQSEVTADAVLVTTGYDVFDARLKEEYGYGIYDNVITSADLELMFSSSEKITDSNGKVPDRIGFVHCVGSRDEKVGHTYCSKVCCVTAVKQAIEIKERHPETEIFCYYMDLRMYGMHFEALYKNAQENHGVSFIRGRLSEACENMDHSIMVKVEDTLAGKPLKMNVDLLVLMVGFVPAIGSAQVGEMLGLKTGVNGFYKTTDQHTLTNISNVPGVFFAGSCTSPKTITNSITDARAAASTIAAYLDGKMIASRLPA